MSGRLVVAIDGPAGAGKSTVTRQVAAKLGYRVLDTGALYRAVAWLAEQSRVDLDQPQALAKLAKQLVDTRALSFGAATTQEQTLWLGEKDITLAIRTQRIGATASRISSMAEVRTALLSLQRQLGQAGGVVVEGRDIGTVVFPEAGAKFFLTARPEVRARRRTEELLARGESADFDTVLAEVEARDRRDQERAVAPLRRAADAELVDSSELTIAEVVERIVERVRLLEAGGSRLGEA